MQLPNESVAVDGVAGGVPAADGSYGVDVALAIPAKCVALVALFGEAVTNPPGSALDRLVPSLQWRGQFDETTDSTSSSGARKEFELNPAAGASGRLQWTFNDGRPLAKVIVRRRGTFFFGPFRSGNTTPASVTGALARLRALFVADTTPAEELLRVLALWHP